MAVLARITTREHRDSGRSQPCSVWRAGARTFCTFRFRQTRGRFGGGLPGEYIVRVRVFDSNTRVKKPNHETPRPYPHASTPGPCSGGSRLANSC